MKQILRSHLSRIENHLPAILGTCLLNAFAFPTQTIAAPFTPGNLAVYRIGNGAGDLLGTGNPVFIDEYTTAGSLVQSISMPTIANGTQKQLISSGTSTSEGLISRSLDGRYLLLAGYATAPGGATSLSSTTSATVNRTVGRISFNGDVDTSTALNDWASANNPRSATSTDGNDIWIAGAAGGVRYATLGASTSLQISTTVANVRQVAGFNGQLYMSSSSGTIRLGPVGVGFPNTTGQTITQLPGFSATGSPYGFFLADLDGTPGLDTLYVSDDTAANTAPTLAGQIQKYCLVSGAWVAKGAITAASVRGLAATVTGNSVTLYGSSGLGTATGGGTIFSATDSSGYNGVAAGAAATLVSLPNTSKMVFRGLALAPITPIPDLTVSVAAPSVAIAGSSLSYTLTASNLGAAAASGVGVAFTLPAGVSFTSASGGGGFTSSVSAGVVTFSNGTINAASSVPLTVTVTTSAPGVLNVPVGAAVIDVLNTVVESDETNNASRGAIATTVADVPDLTVSVTSGTSTQVVAGQDFSYVITASNLGAVPASGVTVKLTLPAGVSFSSGSGAGFTVNEAGGVVTFAGGTIGATSSVSIQVHATAMPAAFTVYTLPMGAVVIDPNSTVSETNETNNVSTTAVNTQIRIYPLPSATGESYATLTNVPLVVNAPQGVLANDADPTLGLTLSTPPAHGKVMINPDGSFSYTPAIGYTGPDSFTYSVSDAVRSYKMNLPLMGNFGGAAVSGDGFGSAIAPVPGTTDEFYGLADRGPNVDGPNDSKIFANLDFVPSIARFKLANGVAALQGSLITLKAPDGTPYNGRPNSGNDTGDLFYDVQGATVATDPNGMDTEGLVAMADGSFWVSDEYGPFLVHFDATGKELMRLSPMNGGLPVELVNRISNRGMEGVTLTPDGSMLVGVMQSALKQPDLGLIDPKFISPARIVTYTIATGALHEYLYMLEEPNTNNKVAISEISAISNTSFLVLERDSNFQATSYKKLHLVDITGATDVGPSSSVAGAVYEFTGTKRGLLLDGKSIELAVGATSTAVATSILAGFNVIPVSKTLHTDIGEIRTALDPAGNFFAHDKIEGVAAADGGSKIILSSDSDFGVDAVLNSAPPWQLRNKLTPSGNLDFGEILVIDRARLPAALATATVNLIVNPAPDINVYNGPAITFPSVDDGLSSALVLAGTEISQPADRTFTLKNTGSLDLTGLIVTVDGPDAANFTISAAPAAPLAPGATTSFILHFAPTTTGVKVASIHIASNALGSKASYDINISAAAGTTPLETWRFTYFNAGDGTGIRANLEDFDGDGTLNLFELAFGTNPALKSSGPNELTQTGTFAGGGALTKPGQPITKFESIPTGIDFRAVFVRRKDYLALGLTYTPEFSANLSVWQNSTAVPTVLADDGALQLVSVPYPPFIAGKKARFFRISVSITP